MVVRITKEDERLLEEYSQAASKSSEKLVYVNAIMISSIPIWLFFGVHKMPLVANSVLFAIISLASTFLMSLAYKNSKAPLMERIAIRRTEAITKEVNSEACKDKKLSKKNREDIVRERTKKVADYESTTFSIFYNNCLFLLLLLLLSAVLHHFSNQMYPLYLLKVCVPYQHFP
ncbi:Translocon-associated protein subunit gamma isoform 1 [Schistosoma japonicum]|uniref:Translocon-associated protein subunit gamma n=2 Tax=Schistosoma japonicum TaxID=6182 RepID=Q5D974_SCHJA|nr:SJCHGC01752 protein [Schistosoma japonicum]KAH8868347.1 Translocon-associated protein subunit gamma [Schistosoma japonicum]KAH8868348.1 Translocon-associated protein subunit gamma [Schistosoma japonicum]TNN16967.1 Translocon-associated protein subunit gamma isoform 1 [Schistosoma japonicum]